jgi:RNA polymerase sigma factor (sigma-70 family)
VRQDRLKAFRDGEAWAVDEVIREYDQVVRNVVERFYRNAFEREEAMQEIWIHAIQRADTVHPDRVADFEGWLATLARHRCVDLWRAAGRAPTGVEVELAAEPSTAVEDAETREAIAAFVSRLRPEEAQFYGLHFGEGLGYPEVAARMGITRLRCKYLKHLIVEKARRNGALLRALGVRGA